MQRAGNLDEKRPLNQIAGPNTLVTSRRPDDLPAFSRELLRALAGLPVAT
jgi:putative intracellular protease/amidase